MKVKTQNGEVVEVKEVSMWGYVISGKIAKDHYIALGHYYDQERVTEVFAEITCAGWNEKNPEYVMPQN